MKAKGIKRFMAVKFGELFRISVEKIQAPQFATQTGFGGVPFISSLTAP